MYSHYKRHRPALGNRKYHPYYGNNHDPRQPRFTYQLHNNIKSFGPNPLTQSQHVPLTPLPLPNGPLFDRTLLEPIWKNTRPIGPGFTNYQNNCFLNSVLECLTYTPSLAQYFLHHGHRNQCTSTSFCAMCALDDHVHRCLVEPKSWIKGATILPRAFLTNLQVFSQTLRLGNQEDAHEFMTCLLDSIHKSTVENYENLDPKVERTSFIYQIFGGQLRSQLRCCNCNAKSDTFDNFLDLSIDLQDATSIQEALTNFIKVDKIGGSDSKYQCEKCQQKVDAEKQMTIQELPSYLCVHLKRFTFDVDSGSMEKMIQDIQYQNDLDMAPFVSEDVDSPSAMYHLYAVLVHVGNSCDRGHYLAYVMAPDGGWFRMDDEDVTPVSLQEVLSQQAYMLFYSTEKHPAPTMNIKNKPSSADELPNYSTDKATPIFDPERGHIITSALKMATESAIDSPTYTFANTTEEEAGDKGTTIDENPDDSTDDSLDNSFEYCAHDSANEKEDNTSPSLDSILGLKYEEYDEYDDDDDNNNNNNYIADGLGTFVVSFLGSPIRSESRSPSNSSASFGDIKVWNIQDQEVFRQSSDDDSDASSACLYGPYGPENRYDF